MNRPIAYLLTAAFTLSACTQPGQGRYGYQDVGHPTAVEFGTIIDERFVEITGQNTGIGATAGMAGGAIAGAGVGGGRGQLGAMLVGALVAGIAGHMAEQAISDHSGIEYTVTMHNGNTITVTQNLPDGDKPLRIGQRVMVQASGSYARVLPADHLPTKLKRPKKVVVED